MMLGRKYEISFETRIHWIIKWPKTVTKDSERSGQGYGSHWKYMVMHKSAMSEH